MRSSLRFTLVSVMLLLSLTPALADIPVELVGQSGGTCSAVAVSGNRAYIGIGPRLVVLDISEPYTPVEIGKTEVLSGVVRDVALSGDYAYVAAGTRLQVVDVSASESPSLVGVCDTTGSALDVAVSGNYAYVACDTLYWDFGELQVVDISNPASPIRVCKLYTSGDPQGVVVSGNYAYVADDDAGLLVVDISNPLSPTLVSACSTGGYAQGVVVSGNYAYVADAGAGLQVINVYNPASPIRVGVCDTIGYASGVAVSGNYAYLVGGWAGLQVIDVTNPASPTQVGAYDTSGSAFGVTISGSYAYVADVCDGLKVIDVADPASPALVGGYDTGGSASGVAMSGNHAYVADTCHGGLQVIDAANPVSPSLVGRWCFDDEASDVTVSGNYAYVAHGWGLQVIDVADPASPTWVGLCRTTRSALGVAVSGDYAYVADGSAGLHVIDVSSPASPTIVGTCFTSGSANDVAVSGIYAYVSNDYAGLQVIDVSNPASPTIVGHTSASANDVVVSGNYAYVVGDHFAGLQVIDVSNPASPVRVGGCNTSGSGEGLVVSGNYAYVADGSAGLHVIDISNPASPVRVGGYDTSGSAFGVAVSGNYVYVADGYAGLEVLLLGGEFPPPTISTIAPDSGPNVTTFGVASIAGTGFYPGVTVKLTRAGESDIVADGVTVVSPTDIVCRFDLAAKAPGQWTVIVTNLDGQSAELDDAFTIFAVPAPTVTGIAPASGEDLGTVTVTDLAGTGFYPGATAKLSRTGEGDIIATGVSVIGSTKITCTFDLTGRTPGPWNVSVRNGDGQSAVLPDGFTITQAAAPTVTGITPASGENLGTVTVTDLAGTGFYPGAAAKLSRTGESDIIAAGVSVIGSTKITCAFDLTGRAVGPWSVVVTNPNGLSSTLTDGFTVTQAAAPTVTGITPASGENLGKVTITDLAGTGFYPVATVKLTRSGESDITASGVTVVSPTKITCAFDLTGRTPGQWSLSVMNGDGQSAFVPDGFTVTQAAAPTVTGTTPASGENLGKVTITDLVGAGFYPGATVKLTRAGESDVVADGVTVVSPTKIVCTFDLARKAGGLWDMVVTNLDGQSGTLTDGFTVTAIPWPFITGITPASGPCTGSVAITNLSGTEFEPGATVKLTRVGKSDINAAGVTVVSPTKITCTFNLIGKTPGQWNVAVTNQNGLSGTLVNGFTIMDTSVPVINSVSISPLMVAATDTVFISTNVTDNVGVNGVTANGTALTNTGGSVWSGDMPADPALGRHFVTIIAGDAAGNTTTNSTRNYRTARVLGITGRDLGTYVLTGSASTYLFRAVGLVTRIDADTFELYDGWAVPVRVSYAAHGLQTGDYATARGIWSLSVSPRVLNASRVTKVL
ncbi:MAG: hypothetical protein KBC96_07715 [Armatimonadetes bacterium]|nr:hypothetical protein [Armatimonadota bacterium]